MSESKHTPGPWSVDGIPSHPVIVGPGTIGTPIAAIVPSDDNGAAPHRIQPNARLIAAAPAYALAWSLLSDEARGAVLADAPEWVRTAILEASR